MMDSILKALAALDAGSWGEWVGAIATLAAVAVALGFAWSERRDRNKAQDELKAVRDRALRQQPSRVYITRPDSESEELASLVETVVRTSQVPGGDAFVAQQTRWVVINGSDFPLFELSATLDGKVIPSAPHSLKPGTEWDLATEQTTSPLVLTFLVDGQRWRVTSDKPGRPELL